MKMDIMECLNEDGDQIMFDCGDDELDPIQAQYYSTKDKDIVELVETIKSCQASIAEIRAEETKYNASLETGIAQRNMPMVPLLKSPGASTQPIVVQASTGVRNGSPGFMVLDPGSLRLVSSSNNIKVYSVSNTTAVAGSCQTVTSLSAGQMLAASRNVHKLPQQLAPTQFRSTIRPQATNTQVVNSTPNTAVSSVVSGMGMEVNVLPSPISSASPFPIQIKVLPTTSNKPRFRVVTRPTSNSPSMTLVSQTSSHCRPIVSNPTSGTQPVVYVSEANTVAQFVPILSQASNVLKFVQIPELHQKTNTARPNMTNQVNNNTNDNTSAPSLPLLPVTRGSPPPLSNMLMPTVADLLDQSKKHTPVQAPVNATTSPNSYNLVLPSGKPGSNSEVFKPTKSKNVSKDAVPSPSAAADQLVDLTAEDTSIISSETELENISSPQNRTAKKNLFKEKTFPSLVVTARACMKVIQSSIANNERRLLDIQLRKILQMSPQTFTEYLLQQRLLRSEQQCKTHGRNLKLGMYSDSARFPHSGGYVWISECCNAGFSSVFAGSIFDKTLQPPATILKLMYHWSCNTAVHSVLQWLKVDNYIVKTYYTFFRAVCTAAVQEKTGMLGGAFKKVQVGVICLGTSEIQKNKSVKIDILAVMDTETMQLRLKALDNSDLSHGNNFFEKKLRIIFEALEQWVHPKSTVITDFAVDLSLCRQYGFGNVVVSGGKSSCTNNLEVVGYLKNWVPKMFQNTLNLLSIQIIQQFLDELVWREQWGPIPSRAFDNLINHISEITKLPGPDIISKLKKIASSPMRNWKFEVWNMPVSRAGDHSYTQKQQDTAVQKSPIPTTPSGPIKQEQSTNATEPSQDSSNHKLTSISYKVPPWKSQSAKDHEGDIEKSTSKLRTPKNPVSSTHDRQPVHENTFDIDDIVPLESYYYGYIDGIPRRQKYTGAFLAECVLCKRDFLTASSFTDHLIHHALNDRATLTKESTDHLSVCKICLVPVMDISSHTTRKHSKPMSSTPTACKICKVEFKTDDKLFKHMATVHCELEMPYSCGECQFRTSIYDDAATHFKHFHDKDSCVQCPFCLKVVRFCTLGGHEITTNQRYFIEHVQKHSVSKLNRKCEKCMLSFTNMEILKCHQENFHTSGKNSLNVVRYNKNPADFVMIRRPNAKPLPPVTLHESSFHTLKGKVLASIFKLDPHLSNFSCAECDSPIVRNHFSAKMTCTRCRFQSHCANAIKEHAARTHLTFDVLVSKIPQVIGGSPLQNTPLFCSKCSFSCLNGNLMATHIATCEGSPVATTEKRKISLNGDELPEFSRKLRKSL